MIVTCSQCLTKFSLDNDRIPEGGAKVRCSKCQHVFTIPKPSPGEQISSSDKTSPSTPSETFSPKIPRQVEMPPRKKPSGRRFLSPFMIVLLLIAAGIGYGVFLIWNTPEISQKIGSGFLNMKRYLGLNDERAGFIALEKVRGYYLENRNQNRIFVIEGQAANHWKEPRSLIKVKGTLMDSQGGKVEEKTSYCGNILLEEDLNAFTGEAIAKSLSSQFGQTFSNVNIPPGRSVPFMIVFTDFSARGTTGREGHQPAVKPGGGSPQISNFLVEVVSSQKGSEGQKRPPSARSFN
jgi:predicted Zn finger-like uncharacterized protein